MGGAGRNRFSAAARSTSTLVRGTRAVSISADISALYDLKAAGLGYTFSWIAPAATGTQLAPVWAAVDPLMSTMVAPGDELRAFWSYTGAFGPGVSVSPAGSNPTKAGDTWSVVPHEQRSADLWLGESAAPAGTVGFRSQVESPSASMGVGLAVDGWVNGVDFGARPALATQLAAGAETNLPLPSRMRLATGPVRGIGTLATPTRPPPRHTADRRRGAGDL